MRLEWTGKLSAQQARLERDAAWGVSPWQSLELYRWLAIADWTNDTISSVGEEGSSIMRRKLPPFPAVRAFEASARHLSFKKAAVELCLTQSAISHQIKSLEDYLGVQLFYRETRAVVLTSEGSSYLIGMRAILDNMATETARISKREIGGSLAVWAAPGFLRWLVPRLSGFHETYPDIELHLTGSLVRTDFASEDVDINIRWGYEPIKGLLATPLIASTRYPVISPELRQKGPAI